MSRMVVIAGIAAVGVSCLAMACGEGTQAGPSPQVAAAYPDADDLEPVEFVLGLGRVRIAGNLAPASDGWARLEAKLSVQNRSRPMNVEYHFVHEVALGSGQPCQLQAGNRLMYAIAPPPGETWYNVVALGPRLSEWLRIERISGAAEED